MSGFSAWQSVMNGLGFVRRRPGLIACWALVLLAWSLIQFVGSLASPMPQVPPGHPWRSPQFLTTGIWLPLHALILAVIWAGACRAFLRPEQRGFAYLRLGRPELLLAIYRMLAVLIWLALAVIVMVAGISAMAADIEFSKAKVSGLAIVVGLPVAIGLATGLIVLPFLIRFSLVAPLVVERQPRALRQSWRLTRGIFWPLAGALTAVGLASLAVSLPLLIFSWTQNHLPTFNDPNWMAAIRQSTAQMQASLAQMHAHPLQALLSPARVVGFVGGAVTQAIGIAVTASIVTTAYSQTRATI